MLLLSSILFNLRFIENNFWFFKYELFSLVLFIILGKLLLLMLGFSFGLVFKLSSLSILGIISLFLSSILIELFFLLLSSNEIMVPFFLTLLLLLPSSFLILSVFIVSFLSFLISSYKLISSFEFCFSSFFVFSFSFSFVILSSSFFSTFFL